MAGKDDKCKTCGMASEGCSAETCGQVEKALYGSLNDIKRVIAVMSGKGGVGKSTVTSLIAVELRNQGFRVGILDADVTGPSIPKGFGIRGGQLQATDFGITPPVTAGGIKLMSVNLFLPREDDPVIWRGPLLAGVINQFWNEVNWGEVDYLLVDLPPGTGDIPLTVLQTLPVDGIIIVTSPQELVKMVVTKAVKMAQRMNKPILGLVENMSYAVCPHCGEKLEMFGPSRTRETAEKMSLAFLGELPWDTEINRLMDQGLIETAKSEEAKNIASQIVSRLSLTDSN